MSRVDWFLVDTAVRFSVPLTLETAAFQHPELEPLLEHVAKLRGLGPITTREHAHAAHAAVRVAAQAANGADATYASYAAVTADYADDACAYAAVAAGADANATATAANVTATTAVSYTAYAAVTHTGPGPVTYAVYVAAAHTAVGKATDAWRFGHRPTPTQSARLIHWLDLDVHTWDECEVAMVGNDAALDYICSPDLCARAERLNELCGFLKTSAFRPPVGLDNKWRRPIWEAPLATRGQQYRSSWTTIMAWPPELSARFIRMLIKQAKLSRSR